MLGNNNVINLIKAVTIFLSASLGKAGLRRKFNFASDYLMAGYVASFILASILLELIAAFSQNKFEKKGTVFIFSTLGTSIFCYCS